MRSKVAVTVLAASMVTAHDAVPVQVPVQPVKTEPEAGVAVRVTLAPFVKDRTLAGSAAGGASEAQASEDSAECGGEHGVCGRAGGHGDPGGGTRPPCHATRRFEACFGVLS